MIKQRIARAGQGKRSGYRTIVLYRTAERALFVYGFAKNEQDNIEDTDLKDYRQLAHEVLNWKQGQVAKVLATGAWIEITAPMEKDDDQETSHARGDAHRDGGHRDRRELGACCRHPPGSLSGTLFRHGSFYERYNRTLHWDRHR